MDSTSLLLTTSESFRRGDDLSASVAESFLDALITESDETILAQLFTTWKDKGFAEDEIYEIAKIMRRRCKRVQSKHVTFVDVVGTGGSKVKTFNVSTAAAFVVAGAGVPVAKHGNKAATSNSGSADVLSALGIEPAVDAATAERCLDEIGICFMYAPNFHRLSPTLAKVRRGLGFPTIFNCVGPLCNPANAPHQLVGVWDKGLLPKMAGALARLGTKKAWIVHGEDGSDEVSISGRTFVAEVENGGVRNFEITPGELDMPHISMNGLAAKTPVESADVILEIFQGKQNGSAAESLALANASVAIYLAGHGKDPSEASRLAVDSIKNGHALRKLSALATAVSK